MKGAPNAVTGTPHTADLNRMSLAAFPALFAKFAPPSIDALPGYYRGEFVGPSWLRAVAPRGLGLIHLGGWWGKEIGADCSGANIVRRGKRLDRTFALRVEPATSVIDGKPVLAVRYGHECPFPWPHVIDEVREINDVLFLGMTVVDAGLLRHLPLPFILHRVERPDDL
jgi:hypothetical protein